MTYPTKSRRTKAGPRLGVTRQLWFWVLVAIVAATILGIVAPTLAKNLQPLGTVFITAIKMIVGPIVFSLVVTGIGGVTNLKEAGRIGLRSIIYFEIVTTAAIVLGLVAVNVFKPGTGLDIDPASINVSEGVAGYIGQGEHKNWWDFLLGIVPKSMVSPFVEGDILQILFIAILVAIAIQLVGSPARPLVSGLEKVNLVMFKVLKIVMYAAPIGVFGALTAMIGAYGLVLVLMLTSKGVAAVTGAGFIVLAATLSVIGSIPVAGIMLIFGINRFLSDGAAITNLCGNTVAGLVISKWEGVLDVDRTKAVLDRKPVEPLAHDADLDTTARV